MSGLEESIYQLSPTKLDTNTPVYFISFVTQRFRGKFTCFRVAEAQMLQVPLW